MFVSKFQKSVINISKLGANDILDYFELFSRFRSVVSLAKLLHSNPKIISK